MVIPMRVIRSEAGEIEEIPGWILLFGRRKTGKTFMLRHQIKHDAFFSVRRDLSIEECRDLDELVHKVRDALSNHKTVILDEFQRLPGRVIDDLAQLHPAGRLILSGSSMAVVGEVLSKKSPLLGLVTPYRLGLIRPSDMLTELLKHFDAVTSVKLGAFLRDPWLIPLLGKDFRKTLLRLIRYTKLSVPGLIGEVFTEEQRRLTTIYDAIIRLIGSGCWDTRRISSVMYSRGLINEPGTNRVSSFVTNLEKMGVVESMPLTGRRPKHLRLQSSVMMLHFYLEDRYAISERDFSPEEVLPTAEVLVGREVENFVVDLLAQLGGLRKEKRLEDEIDGILTRRNRIVRVIEVKWRPLKAGDVQRFLESASDLPGEKVFVCTKKRATRIQDVKVMDAMDLASLAQGSA